MKDLVDAVAQADNPYALFAVAIIGLYVLLWRWGGKLIEALRENTRITKANGEIAHAANSTVSDVKKAIITNHGSKNIGDAIDRITETLHTQGESARADREQVKSLQQAFITRVLEGDSKEDRIYEQFGKLDERLSAIEAVVGLGEPVASAQQISGGE